MNLLRTNRNDIAAAMNIPPNHFRWYAAYHDEGDHPHVHMMLGRRVPSEAYLTREGIHNIKSQLTNQIFQQEMLHTYEQNLSRGMSWFGKLAGLSENSRGRWHEVSALTLRSSRKWNSWPDSWETVNGKKSYGYLPKPVKKTVDEIVDKLEELPVVRECYDQWCVLQK